MRTGLILITGLCALAASVARAAPAIDVGSIDLQPNQQGQEVQLFVTGGDAVAALDLIVQVGRTEGGNRWRRR
jgi:hypothetical protein